MAYVVTGEQQVFSAAVYDQEGSLMQPQPALIWGVGSGIGSINDGLFTAGMTPGPGIGQAQTGDAVDAAEVTVISQAEKPVNVIYPVGGDSVGIGARLTINYGIAPYIRGVMIRVSPDSGQHFYDILNEPKTRWSGYSYSWTIPESIDDGTGTMVPLISDQVLIRVEDQWDEAIGDNCDGVFSSTPSLSLIEPHGDSVYHTGDTISVQWEALNFSVVSVVIELSVDGGDSWVPLTPEALMQSDSGWGTYD